MTTRIEGTITLTSHMTIADALNTNLRFDYDRGLPTYDKVGLPLTSTVQKGLLLPGNERPVRVPYIPSNNLRGRLRRFCATEFLQAVVANDRGVTVDTFDGMNAGNFRGQPDNTEPTLEELIESANHTFMGLFGGGPRTLRSRLITSDADPICLETIDSGIVPSRYAPGFQGDPKNMLEYSFMTRRDDTSSFANPKIMDLVQNPIDSILSRDDELSAARVKRKAGKVAMKAATDAKERAQLANSQDVKKTDLANMVGYQSARSGLSFYFRLGFAQTPTDAQIGLITSGLHALFVDNNFGIRRTKGMGAYIGQANLVLDDRVAGPLIQRTSDTDDQMDPTYELTDLASPYINAKDEVLDETDADDIERFFVYKKPATKRAKTKGAAA